MAVAYLNPGATSLAAANWSDTTGFANSATLVIKSGSQDIQSDLAYTSVTSLNYLDIYDGFSGYIGGSGGSLTVDADGTDTVTGTPGPNVPISRIRYMASGGHFYYNSNNGCNNFIQASTGKAYLTGGAFKRIILESGQLNIASAVTELSSPVWYFAGGSAVLESHASNTFTTINATGGSHVIKRAGTTLNVTGGSVTLDASSGSSLYDVTTVNVYGGVLYLKSFGTITNLNIYSGTVDASRLSACTGATNTLVGPRSNLVYHPLLSLGTKTVLGSGGGLWGGGNAIPL